MISPEEHRIGGWLFDVETGALRSREETRKLEDRTARTLELLCRRRGSVVSQSEILKEVWLGRAVSPNSVAVVIGDLRRILHDDARSPTHIETVAKRGYRLTFAGDAPEEGADKSAPARRRDALGLTALACLAVIGIFPWSERRPAEVLIVEPVANATGSARYQPLTSALGELVTGEMSGAQGVQVVRSSLPSGKGEALKSRTLISRLILWNGMPTLSMTMVDSRSHVILWTGMAEAGKDRLSTVTITRLSRLRERLTQNAI